MPDLATPSQVLSNQRFSPQYSSGAETVALAPLKSQSRLAPAPTPSLQPWVKYIMTHAVKERPVKNITHSSSFLVPSVQNWLIFILGSIKELNHSLTTMIVFGSLQNFTSL